MKEAPAKSNKSSAQGFLLRQVKNFITSTYIPAIDQVDLAKHQAVERDRTLLSRGLAAMAAHNFAHIELAECTRLVVDQSKDNGIDAVAFDPSARVFYLVQAKYFEDGKGGVTTDGVLKLIKGFVELLDDELVNFGSKMLKIHDEVRSIMDLPGVKFTLVYVHTGSEEPKTEQISSLNKIKKEFNTTLNPNATPLLDWKICKLSAIYEWLQAETSHGPIDLDVDLLEWGEVSSPYAVYGQVKGIDIAKWWQDYGPRLVENNIRSFLGVDTGVNRGLLETIEAEPQHFWHYNNGITVVCESVERVGPGRTREHSVFKAKRVSIVNGAQTVATISEANNTRGLDLSSVKVLARFIQVGAGVDPILSETVTRATNTQNSVTGRDFVSLDPEQYRIRDELRADNIDYVIKRGDAPGERSISFNFDEAVVALACAQPSITFAVRAKRAISDLWQDTSKGNYKVLFNSATSSLRVWRSVQIVRLVEDALAEERKALSGKGRGLVVHGNRFLAHCVFRKLGPRILDGEVKVSSDDASVVFDASKQLTSLMLSTLKPDEMVGYPAVFFKNQLEQEKLFELMNSAPPTKSDSGNKTSAGKSKKTPAKG